MSGFVEDSFAATEKAINAVAASGDPRAAPLLAALADGRLLSNPVANGSSSESQQEN